MIHRTLMLVLLLSILLIPGNLAQADQEITLIIELEKGIDEKAFLLVLDSFEIQYTEYHFLTLFEGLILKLNSSGLATLKSLPEVKSVWLDEPTIQYSKSQTTLSFETSIPIAVMDTLTAITLDQYLPRTPITIYSTIPGNTANLLKALDKLEEDIVYIPVTEISAPIEKALNGLNAKGILPVVASQSCQTSFTGPGYIQKETTTNYLCSETNALTLLAMAAKIMDLYPDWSLQQLYLSMSHLGIHLDDSEEFLPEYVPPKADILLVDGAGYELFGMQIDQYETSLTKLGYRVAHWSIYTEGEPALDILLEYPLVIWYTGPMYLPTYSFPGTSTLSLMSYLEEGGSLLLSGQQIGYMLGKDHQLLKYLSIESFQDEHATEVNGIPLHASLANYWPQSFTVTQQSHLLHYDTGNIAGIIIEEPVRLAFLGFSLEGLLDSEELLKYLLIQLTGR